MQSVILVLAIDISTTPATPYASRRGIPVHDGGVCLFPMHLSKALPQAQQECTRHNTPHCGGVNPSAVLAKIVVVFWTNGLPTPGVARGFLPRLRPEFSHHRSFDRFRRAILYHFHFAQLNANRKITTAAPGRTYKPSGPARRHLPSLNAPEATATLYDGNWQEAAILDIAIPI